MASLFEPRSSGETLVFRCLNFTRWTLFELRSKLSEGNRSAFRRRINTLIRPRAEQTGCDEELQCRGAPIFRLQTSQPALRQLERLGIRHAEQLTNPLRQTRRMADGQHVFRSLFSLAAGKGMAAA